MKCSLSLDLKPLGVTLSAAPQLLLQHSHYGTFGSKMMGNQTTNIMMAIKTITISEQQDALRVDATAEKMAAALFGDLCMVSAGTVS